MRPPTANAVTQTIHGPYNAVDYSANPDADFYAPEDGQVVSYAPSGDCGNNLQIQGANGRHGFCHLETSYVSVGQQVKKGQKLGRMGYTGLTIPKGPGGRHLHWVIRLSNGNYVYPPSRVTEPFNNQGGQDMPNDGDIDNAYLLANGRKATEQEKAIYRSKPFNAPDGLLYGKILVDAKPEGRPAGDWMAQAKDAEQYKQQVVKSAAWTRGMGMKVGNVKFIIDDLQKFKDETIANPSGDAAQKLQKIKEIIGG